jgi:uncharacterized protein YeaO (DUF488 family)
MNKSVLECILFLMQKGDRMAEILIKRIYDPFEESDGDRILVDRLWPRGISKEKAKLTYWAKDIAPSNELRKWFGHSADLFEEFKSKYLKELRSDEHKWEKVNELSQMATAKRMTLLYAAKEPMNNHARVLREELLRIIAESEKR